MSNPSSSQSKTLMQKIFSKMSVHSKWRLALKTLPIVLFAVLLKVGANYFDLEFLSLNSLFTALISANIFLIGFLISGTLVDYKESEKLPGDLAASLEAMADEGLIIYKNHKSAEAKNYLQKLLRFNQSLIDWFYKKERTENLMEKLLAFNEDFLALESQTQANFIVRLKQEQNAIRRMINRIHTIRETSFLVTGYAIAEIITSISVVGLIFIQMDPFYEGFFFIFFVSFILVYMIFFIKDLDNPFGYDEKDSLDDEISLQVLIRSQGRLRKYCEELA